VAIKKHQLQEESRIITEFKIKSKSQALENKIARKVTQKNT